MTISMPKFLHRYNDEPVANRLKVKRLFFLESMILGMLAAVLMLLLSNKVMLITVLALAIANGTALFLLIRGYQAASEILHFVSLTFSFMAGLLFATDRNYDLPIFALVAVLFLLDILLTTSKSWRLYLFVVLMIVVPLISRTLYLSDNTREELRFVSMGDLMLFEVVICFIGVAAIVLYRDSRSMLAMMLNKAEESDSRYASIRNLFETSRGTLEIGETLEHSSSETLKAVTTIKKDILAIRDGILYLDKSVDTYGDNSVSALKAAEHLESASQEQSSSVAETAAIIEQMSASIRSVSEISESKRTQVDQLVQVSSKGQDRVRDMNSAMELINQTSREVMDVITIIDNVSAQTNLLAMNAAIEAAHAGDAGRGFAVVAGEIRKLSEATNENTSRIRMVLESSNKNIDVALQRNGEVSDMMQTIGKEIEEVSISISEIIGSLLEMSSGTHEVNTAVMSIRDLTVRTDDTVKELKGKITENDTEVAGIASTSRENLEKVQRTIEAFEDIVKRTDVVRELGLEAKVSMNNLTEEISAI